MVFATCCLFWQTAERERKAVAEEAEEAAQKVKEATLAAQLQDVQISDAKKEVRGSTARAQLNIYYAEPPQEAVPCGVVGSRGAALKFCVRGLQGYVGGDEGRLTVQGDLPLSSFSLCLRAVVAGGPCGLLPEPLSAFALALGFSKGFSVFLHRSWRRRRRGWRSSRRCTRACARTGRCTPRTCSRRRTRSRSSGARTPCWCAPPPPAPADIALCVVHQVAWVTKVPAARLCLHHPLC